MKIVRLPFSLTAKDDPLRSPGIHLSGIVRDIGLQMGYLPPQYASEDVAPDPTRICLGLAWEDWVFPHAHPEVVYHPGELDLCGTGIAGTADGVSWLDTGEQIVHECKLTWKSMKRDEDLSLEWMWLAQTMAYCKGWNVRRARYHIYWVNGNYKYGTPEGGPQYRLYDLEFTQRELDDNFRMITNHGKHKFGLK